MPFEADLDPIHVVLQSVFPDPVATRIGWNWLMGLIVEINYMVLLAIPDIYLDLDSTAIFPGIEAEYDSFAGKPQHINESVLLLENLQRVRNVAILLPVCPLFAKHV